MPGMGELLIILVIVMLIFGAGKLPAIGESLGRSIKNFKRATNGEDEIEVKKRSEQLESKRAAALDAGEEAEEAELVQKRKSVKKEA